MTFAGKFSSATKSSPFATVDEADELCLGDGRCPWAPAAGALLAD